MQKSASEQVAGHSFLNFLGNGIRLFLSFALSLLASRWLGAEGFGQISLIFAYTGIFNFLLTLGFDYGLPYFIPQFVKQERYRDVLRVLKVGLLSSLGLGIIILPIFAFVGPWLLKLKGFDQLTIPFLFVLVQTQFWAIGTIMAGYLSAGG